MNIPQTHKQRRALLKLGKRQRFILATLFFAALYVFGTFFTIEQAFFIAPLLAVGVYGLSYLALLEGIQKHEKIMLFIIPVYFSVVVYLFYFFVPQRWLTRIPFVTIYSVSMYAILLCQNIFNVGVNKSLQLFRAAFSVNYLFVTLCSFIAFSLVASLRLHSIFNALLIGVLSFPLVLQLLWSVDPTEMVPPERRAHAGLLSLILGELAMILSFMPVNQSIFALTLTSFLYGMSGVVQLHMHNLMYRERVREYLFILISSAAIVFMTLGW